MRAELATGLAREPGLIDGAARPDATVLPVLALPGDIPVLALLPIALIAAAIAGFIAVWFFGSRSLRREAAILAASAVVIGLVLLPGALDRSATDPAPAEAGDEAAVIRGEAIYQAQCAACHGATGQGDGPEAAGLNPPPADFTSPLHRIHGARDLIFWVENGIPGSAMPAFGDRLSDQEIADVVAYVQSLAGDAARQAASGVVVPAPHQCTVEPVYPSDLIPPGTPPAGQAVLIPTPPAEVGSEQFPWPQGTPASAEEAAGARATIEQFVACANAGDYPRRLALYTRRSMEPQFAALDAAGRQGAIDLATTPATPLPEEQWTTIQTITDARRLADGRVAVYVITQDPVNHPHLTRVVLILMREGERWLIDEIHPDTRPSATPATGASLSSSPPNRS